MGLVALGVILLSVLMLERARAGLVWQEIAVGRTPATLIARPEATGPLIVVAHGFAGSRQIMQGYTLALAQAGYRVLAFDFEGHGRNPVPMSGDVTRIDGTTARLVTETQAVIATAREIAGAAPVALLGHSMATDVLIRASAAEEAAGRPIAALVAVSMYSEAISPGFPARLLVISGQWEPHLRAAGLAAVRQVDPAAEEGDLAVAAGVERMAVVAPRVEHVGVLFSPVAVAAAQDWLDRATGHESPGAAPAQGLWILLAMAGIVTAFRPLVALLPQGPALAPLPARRFLLAVLLPALVAPLLVAPLYRNFLPVLVADYLLLHLAVFGAVQMWLARLGGFRPAVLLGSLALAVWGIAVFGLALDRYGASFWPMAARLPIIALLCLGTIPFMLGDAAVTGAGHAPLWQQVLARVSVVLSLGLGAVLNPGEVGFVLTVLPVLILFFLVHGLMGRWVARRAGVWSAGIGLGLCLAWALGVSFPLFAPP